MITLAGLTLNDDLVWTDEFSWLPVEQGIQRTLGGKQIIQSRVITAGRPITLMTDDKARWSLRSDIEALYALAESNQTLTLSLHDGRSFSVQFRYDDQPIDATPVLDQPEYVADDRYSVTIKLRTV